MLGVQSMQMAGLLGGTFGRRSLAVASAILVVRLVLVAVGGVIARLVIARLVIDVVAIVLPVAARPFVGDMLEFVVIARLKLVAVITTSCLADLVLTLLLK
jgi:hypothetical protein